MIPKLNRRLLNQGIDIPHDPIEYGRMVLRDYLSDFESLPCTVKQALVKEALATDPKLVKYYAKLQDEIVWPLIECDPNIIQHINDASLEMWQYALARDPELIVHANATIFLKMGLIGAKYNLDKIRHVENFPEEKQLPFVKDNLVNIANIRNPCLEVCLYVMERDPNLFPYIQNPPVEICQIAFDYDIEMIKYIRRPSIAMVNRVIHEKPLLAYDVKTTLPEEFCSDMLDEYGYFIDRIKRPTNEQALRAFKTYPSVIYLIEEPTEDMCWRAITQDPHSFFGISDEHVTEEMLWYMIKNHVDTILVHEDLYLDLTTDMIQYAIENCPEILKFKEIIPEEMCYEILDKYPIGGIQYITNPSDELFFVALDRDLKNIKYVGDFTEAKLYALRKDPMLIYYCRYPSAIECFVAILLDPRAIHLINHPSYDLHANMADCLAIIRGEKCTHPDYIKACEYLNIPV